MARDTIGDRYEKKKRKQKLQQMSQGGMSTEDIETEQAAIAKARDERAKDPERYRLKSTGEVGRNDPCPCGSGKKYKKCCGREK